MGGFSPALLLLLQEGGPPRDWSISRFTGLIGLVVILAVAYLFSTHKREIKLKLIAWGMGLVSVLRGNSAQAAQLLERAVDLLPEWAGSQKFHAAMWELIG